MPGFDGAGPSGQGPMTGRGQGFCVLKVSEEKPGEMKGLVGLQSVPISHKVENRQVVGKEVVHMPFGDGTGPAGLGPMTGRAAGFCAGYPVPGYMNPVAGRAAFYGAGMPAVGPYNPSSYGYGAGYGVPYAGRFAPWFRRPFGFRGGFGRGRGRGRGRARFGY